MAVQWGMMAVKLQYQEAQYSLQVVLTVVPELAEEAPALAEEAEETVLMLSSLEVVYMPEPFKVQKLLGTEKVVITQDHLLTEVDMVINLCFL